MTQTCILAKPDVFLGKKLRHFATVLVRLYFLLNWLMLILEAWPMTQVQDCHRIFISRDVYYFNKRLYTTVERTLRPFYLYHICELLFHLFNCFPYVHFFCPWLQFTLLSFCFICYIAIFFTCRIPKAERSSSINDNFFITWFTFMIPYHFSTMKVPL